MELASWQVTKTLIKLLALIKMCTNNKQMYILRDKVILCSAHLSGSVEQYNYLEHHICGIVLLSFILKAIS